MMHTNMLQNCMVFLIRIEGTWHAILCAVNPKKAVINVLLKDTSVITRTGTHTLLIRRTRPLVWSSYLHSHNAPRLMIHHISNAL